MNALLLTLIQIQKDVKNIFSYASLLGQSRDGKLVLYTFRAPCAEAFLPC